VSIQPRVGPAKRGLPWVNSDASNPARVEDVWLATQGSGEGRVPAATLGYMIPTPLGLGKATLGYMIPTPLGLGKKCYMEGGGHPGSLPVACGDPDNAVVRATQG